MKFQKELKELRILVKKFAEQENFYEENYNETETRRDFIDEFFQLLGWDIGNKEDLPVNQREVNLENNLENKETKTQSKVDYCFSIGGAKQFFVEAKRPEVRIKPGYKEAQQTRRYGYSANLPLCILTDFQELAIYDTRIKPKENDDSKVARYRYWNYKEYEENFEEIYNLFSREAVSDGSLESWKKENKNPKANLPVDKAFLQEIENWRSLLARDIATKNKNTSNEELNHIVQKIIDCIIFLRIAESREMEDYKMLVKENKETSYQKHLLELFRKAENKYNGGFFSIEKDFPKLTISDKVLKEIIENLYFPKSPYEFSVFDAEILGRIYEQFLGNVIRLTAQHHAKVEQKPEVKKAGGVYYTPKYIVEYIVENTVGKKIKNKKPEEIATLKILDPACGSGSFLIEVYRYLLEYHLAYYQKNNLKQAIKKNLVYEKLSKTYALTIQEKQRILLGNIYGVDIDRQAVEVTKLSLFLTLMEDENQESVGSLLKYSDSKPLPNLAKNIKFGNSLVSSDFDSNVSFLEEEKRKIARKINVFDWDDKELGFGNITAEGGFDVVLGNPPYIQLQKFTGEIMQEALQKAGFKTHHSMGDIYALFYEKGYQLLKKNGLFGFITSNKWLRAGYGEPLRNFLLSNTAIQYLVDLSFLGKVFQDATVDTHIVIFEKKAVKKQKAKGCFLKGDIKTKKDIKEQTKKNFVSLPEDENLFLMLSQNEVSLKNKIEKIGKPLAEWDITINRGIVTGYNEAFLINDAKRKEILANCQSPYEQKKTEEIIQPILRGRDIKRYNHQWAGLYIIGTFPALKLKIQDYPAIEKYLLQFGKNKLAQTGKTISSGVKARKKTNNQWFETQDQIGYHQEFKKEKIIYPETTLSANFYLDKEKKFFAEKTTFILVGEKLTYLTGLLSSKLITYYFLKYSAGTKLAQKGYQYNKHAFNIIPIPTITKENEKIAQKIEQKVEEIIVEQKNLNNARIEDDKTFYLRQVKAIDNTINKLVYELYKLTKEEIQTIESSQEKE